MKAQKQAELESNAEYQRRKVMTKDERSMISRDIISKNLHEQNVRDGKNTTYESALQKATEIAHKVLREEQEGKRKK